MNEPDSQPIANGTVDVVEGKPCIFFDGYWIRHYKPPPESLSAKKQLIDSLKRRLFHHTEPGINTPGARLEAARQAYNAEEDPTRRRVNGTMLAGALFNRATDIFTTVVDLEGKGVKISPDNELLIACGEYFQEALALGKLVKHHSGHEGVDELWGEPLKAFTMPIADFYESRYIKIAQTMRDIDQVTDAVKVAFQDEPGFEPIAELFDEFCAMAKLETETMRRDMAIFEVWPGFVAAGEAIVEFEPVAGPSAPESLSRRKRLASRLLSEGRALVGYLAGVRTPMPKSTAQYLQSLADFSASRV